MLINVFCSFQNKTYAILPPVSIILLNLRHINYMYLSKIKPKTLPLCGYQIYVGHWNKIRNRNFVFIRRSANNWKSSIKSKSYKKFQFYFSYGMFFPA